jgi:GNAT superfamily N-acetyltransferase
MNAASGEFTISFDSEAQQPERVHAYLTRSYWAEGISLELVRRCLAGSLCCGAFRKGCQIGLARVVTDRASFAYLCDVYVLEEFRGLGIATRMMKAVVSHPDLQGLRRFVLATRDAHSFYERFGFAAPARPQSIMEINRRGLYLQRGEASLPLNPVPAAGTPPARLESSQG